MNSGAIANLQIRADFIEKVAAEQSPISHSVAASRDERQSYRQFGTPCNPNLQTRIRSIGSLTMLTVYRCKGTPDDADCPLFFIFCHLLLVHLKNALHPKTHYPISFALPGNAGEPATQQGCLVGCRAETS